MIMLPAFEEIAGAISPQVYFTTGFRISEVTCRSAIFWTRLCRQETPVPIRHKRREEVFRHPIDFDENQPVEKMDGAVAGTAGIVRIIVMNGSTARWEERRVGKEGVRTGRSSWSPVHKKKKKKIK